MNWTKEDVLRMARDAGLLPPSADPTEAYIPEGLYAQELERFASVVAAAEREACAKLCEVSHGTIKRNPDSQEIAAAIRARGAT